MILGKNCARLPAGPVCFFLCRANGVWKFESKRPVEPLAAEEEFQQPAIKSWEHNTHLQIVKPWWKGHFRRFRRKRLPNECKLTLSQSERPFRRFSWLEGLKSFQLSLAKATGYNFIGRNFEMGFGKQSIQLLQRGFIRGGVDRHKSVVTCDHTNATPKRLEILYNVVVQGSHHVLDPNFQDASWFQTQRSSTQEIARCQFSNAPSTWKTTISCRLGYDTIPATKWFHSVPSSHLRP